MGLADNDIKLYVKVILTAGEDSVAVVIKHTHTNVTRIEENGRVVLDIPCADGDFNSSPGRPERPFGGAGLPAGQGDRPGADPPLFLDVINLNSRIAHEGLSGHYGVNTGRMIMEHRLRHLRQRRPQLAAAFAAAGSDACMSGCALPS